MKWYFGKHSSELTSEDNVVGEGAEDNPVISQIFVPKSPLKEKNRFDNLSNKIREKMG